MKLEMAIADPRKWKGDRRKAVDVGNEISGGEEREQESQCKRIFPRSSCVPYHTSILNGRWWLGRRAGCKLPFVYLEWLVGGRGAEHIGDRVGGEMVVGDRGAEMETGYRESSSVGIQNGSDQLQKEVAILSRTLSAKECF